MKTLFYCLLVVGANSLFGQDHYLVELENRGPDVLSLVKSYEGYPSIPFMANDMYGNAHSLMSMKGKTVVLWFWNQECPKCIGMIPDLNKLQSSLKDEISIIGFADESKASVSSFLENHSVDFPIIPNSKTLADGPYGGDMGYPRFFIIDEYGVIKFVLPEIQLRGDFKTFDVLTTLHHSIK